MKSRLRLAAATVVLLASCGAKEQPAQTIARRVDSIDISDVVVALPEGEGREQIERSCVPCHSLRYIEMQPAMPKKSWEKIVTKMIKMYGAPVRDSIAEKEIVDYLVAIKGEK
jgi:cytochrome c5